MLLSLLLISAFLMSSGRGLVLCVAPGGQQVIERAHPVASHSHTAMQTDAYALASTQQDCDDIPVSTDPTLCSHQNRSSLSVLAVCPGHFIALPATQYFFSPDPLPRPEHHRPPVPAAALGALQNIVMLS